MKYLYTSLIMLLLSYMAFAQDSTSHARDSSKGDKQRSYFKASMNYQSDNVYLGRKDTSALPYFVPMMTYYHKSGLYFAVSADYLHTATDQRIDVVTLEGGYDFEVGKYSGEVYVSKYFYNSQSTSVTSGITASLAFLNEYDLGWIKPSFAATLDLGTNTDFQGAFGVEHKFELLKDKLEITPSIVVNGSTLNFYDNYYKTRRFKKRKGQKTVTGTVNVTGTVTNASAFTILDYEPGLSVKYIAGRWTFDFSPTYAMPVHPAALSIHSVYSTGAVTNRMLREKLENTFIWTLGVVYKL